MGKLDCRICYTKYRDEIENLLKDGVQMVQIARQYSKPMGVDVHLLEQSIASHKKHIPNELTVEDKLLLERFRKGEVNVDEVSRIVAGKVFTKMLKYPEQFRFIDYFRTELLRQKDEENQIRDKWAREAINRLFAGKLPPREHTCSNCGHTELTVKDSLVLVPENVIEGEEPDAVVRGYGG